MAEGVYDVPVGRWIFALTILVTAFAQVGATQGRQDIPKPSSANVGSTSKPTERQPGRIFVSYSVGTLPSDREAFESSLGLSPPIQSFDRPEALGGPRNFFEYRVDPGTEITWINVLLKIPMVYRASWSAQHQLDDIPPGAYRSDEGTGQPIERIGVLAIGPPIRSYAHPPIASAEDALCAPSPISLLSPLGASRTGAGGVNRAGDQLYLHNTIHDLVRNFVTETYRAKGGRVETTNDFQHRFVFDISSIRGEVLQHNRYWEKLKLEVFYIEPHLESSASDPVRSSSCIQIDLTLTGKYAAGTLTEPQDGFFRSMEPDYSEDEHDYLGQIGVSLKNYLQSAEPR